MEIKEQLGPFVYPHDPSFENDGVTRKKRPMATLENGA
jgi:hypothetical protein